MKKALSTVDYFAQFLYVVFTNTKTFMEGEIKYTTSTTKQGFPMEVLSKTKYPRLTNLAFMQLVPGDDQVVRHICMQCIVVFSTLYSSDFVTGLDSTWEKSWNPV